MLDLNNPEDARAYVMTWVDEGEIRYKNPLELSHGTDEDFLRVAKQLFLYCDVRPLIGGIQ